MNKRVVIYPIVILFALILMILPGFLTNPHRNLSSVAGTATTNTQQTVHQSFSSYLKQFPGGYVLTFHTGNDSSFAPTEFVTITRMNKTLIVDVINGAGPSNAHRLRGQSAADFLKDHQIDLSAFDVLIDD